LDNKGFPIIITISQMLSTIAAIALLNLEFDEKIQIILICLFFTVASFAMINFFYGQRQNSSTAKSLFQVFRLTRHDFQNHLQVLYSMIQLKKYEDALKYIDSIKNRDKEVSYICNNLTDVSVISCLLEMLYTLKRKNIGMSIEVIDKEPYIPQLSKLTEELQRYILQLDKFQGKKDIKIILGKSKLEICSETIGERVVFSTKHINLSDSKTPVFKWLNEMVSNYCGKKLIDRCDINVRR